MSSLLGRFVMWILDGIANLVDPHHPTYEEMCVERARQHLPEPNITPEQAIEIARKSYLDWRLKDYPSYPTDPPPEVIIRYHLTFYRVRILKTRPHQICDVDIYSGEDTMYQETDY